MHYIFLFLALVASVFAGPGTSPNILFHRQSCPSSYKTCGTGCIATANTCCPDGSGGCPPTSNCQLGTNNKYLCCPKGEVCVGTGGVRTNTIYNTDYTSSYYYYTSTSTPRITTTRYTYYSQSSTTPFFVGASTTSSSSFSTATQSAFAGSQNDAPQTSQNPLTSVLSLLMAAVAFIL